MPKVTGTGSGMTGRGVVEFDWDDPEDVKAQIAAAIETLNRGSFARVFHCLTKIATGILEEAGLPSDPDLLYAVTLDGQWGVLKGATRSKAVVNRQAWPLAAAVTASGYPVDSREGYAARVLELLSDAEREARAGHVDEAMALAFAAGELTNEAGMKATYEEEFLVGDKVRAGGRAASIATHGTEAERTGRREELAKAVDLLVSKGEGWMSAYRAVAKLHKVSESTVRRAVREVRSRT